MNHTYLNILNVFKQTKQTNKQTKHINYHQLDQTSQTKDRIPLERVVGEQLLCQGHCDWVILSRRDAPLGFSSIQLVDPRQNN